MRTGALSESSRSHGGPTLDTAYEFLCSKHGVVCDVSDVQLLFRRLSPANDGND